ncbi:hypothetical protein POTOM_030630 [Populus tomentosa]|uniref:GDSL-like Lipase/Acylhydrolase superfamily protein n=1 Tax=Populus tomentosa TaxID=118781 RepID=A0A8X7Z916_POPTO|nr:hypothetical protein POTOM_030630 [Populus tomentosa]
MSFALDRQRFIIMGIVSQTSVVCLLLGQELGLKIFPPPYLAPTTVGDVLLNGVNYASSGSGILKATGESFGDRISLENQIIYFEKTRKDIISNIGIQAAKKLLREAIYILIIGTNDIRDNSNVVDSGAVLDTIISSLRSQLTRLYKLGARKLVVGNCAPYGCIPYTRDEYAVKDGCVSAANHRAQSFNKKLKPMLEGLTKNLSGSIHVYANIYAVFLDIVQLHVICLRFHALFCFPGFEDAENACCSVVGAHGGIIPCSTISQVCSDRTKKVFWDPFHLTESAYLITAKHLLDGDLNYTSPMNFRQLANT